MRAVANTWRFPALDRLLRYRKARIRSFSSGFRSSLARHSGRRGLGLRWKVCIDVGGG